MYGVSQHQFVKQNVQTLGYAYDRQGQKVGSTINGRVYDFNGHYVGELVHERVYDANGSRVGRVINSHLYDAEHQKVGYLGNNGYAYDKSGEEIGKVWLARPNRMLGAATAMLLLFDQVKKNKEDQ